MLFCYKVDCDIHGLLVVENAPNDWGITFQLGRFSWLKIYSPFLSLFWYKVWLWYIRGLLCWESPNDWGITDYSGSSERGIWLDLLPLSNTLPQIIVLSNMLNTMSAQCGANIRFPHHFIDVKQIKMSRTLFRIMFKTRFKKQNKLVSRLFV